MKLDPELWLIGLFLQRCELVIITLLFVYFRLEQKHTVHNWSQVYYCEESYKYEGGGTRMYSDRLKLELSV